MKSYLHQLENNEAILLMYIADELPTEDRQEVEQMLASDAGMRRDLESLIATQEKCSAALAGLDEQSPPSVPDHVALRQVNRLMQRWHVERTLAPKAPVPSHTRFGWKTLGSVAAAIVLICGFSWWVIQAPPVSQPANNGLAHNSRFGHGPSGSPEDWVVKDRELIEKSLLAVRQKTSAFVASYEKAQAQVREENMESMIASTSIGDPQAASTDKELAALDSSEPAPGFVIPDVGDGNPQ